MRYVLHEGYVISRNDGQVHFISAKRLKELYGITTEPHILAPHREARRARAWRYQPDDIKLWPRDDGNYRLPPHHEPGATSRDPVPGGCEPQAVG